MDGSNSATNTNNSMDGGLPVTAWFRLVSWSLDEAKRRRPQHAPFVSLLLPPGVAQTVADHLSGRGYRARVRDGYTANARSLTIWWEPQRPALAPGRVRVVDAGQ